MGKIIAATRNAEEFNFALESKADIVFMLSTNIEELKEQIDMVHKNGKKLFVHIDLADGVGKDEYGIKYVKNLGTDFA